MGLNKYCFCYSIDVGGTLIGFLQLNAAIYYWARFAQLEPIFCWLDLCTALLYTVRTTYFFMCVAQEYSLQSKRDYFDAFKWTTFPLVAVAAAIPICKSIEYQHIATW